MTIVLAHGVPEVAALWDGLRTHLGRTDVATVALPGFGTPRPPGFGATKEEYVDWLVAELEGFGEPVDLVGHDWGGGLVVRLVSLRPDLVRSWVTDAAALGSADFEWHDFAKIWQTPGDGEDFFAGQLAATAAERGGVFELFGVPHDDAMAMGTWLDQTMVDCILALYRSATRVGIEWSPDFHDIPKPGTVMICSEDAFLDDSSARAAAEAAGAPVVELQGIGHWWMLQDPAAGAAVLEAFWASLD